MCGFALVAFILLVLIVSVFLPSEKRSVLLDHLKRALLLAPRRNR